MANKTSYNKKSKKTARAINLAEVYVLSTFNNMIISLTDASGNVVAQCSSGMVGASGSKKASSYYASMVINNILSKAEAFSIKAVSVIFRGPGINGRDAVVKVLNEYVNRNTNNFAITCLKDFTPVPHNGCRSRKRRRT
jgi:small subunit ribosomal protein S11